MKQLKAICQLLLDLLRELGDQNAYQRYLTIQGRRHSREEWQRFCEEHLGAKYQRTRCC
jgi:cell division inhibitor SulA